MSKTNYAAIEKYLITKSKEGIPFELVKTKYTRELDLDATEQVEASAKFLEASKNYPNFDLVQKVLTLEFVMDIETGDYYLIDQERKQITPVAEKALKNLFTPKAFTYIQDSRLHSVYMGYNPNEPSLFYHKEGDACKTVNLYRQADWHMGLESSELEQPVKLPTIYKEFLTHFTMGSELSYNYLINFMASCIQPDSRALTYCCLLSLQGTGKGVIFSILSELLGHQNVSYIKADKLSDIRFNGFAKDKKLLFFDEVDIRNSKDEQALKFYTNPVLEIERKGRDSKSYENFANIMLASNSLTNLRIESDDRRFSFVDVVDRKLTLFAKEKYNLEIEQYVTNNLLNADNIKQLGLFLLQYPIDRSQLNTPILSEAKKNQKLHSLKDYELSIFMEMAPKYAGKELTLQEAKIALQELTDNSKINPGRESWLQLSQKVPGYFSRIKKKLSDGRQVYCVKFEALDKQPKFVGSEKEG